MASTIAAVTTGGGGVITTADSSGNLSLLSGATTVVAVTSAGVAVTGTLSATGATNLAVSSGNVGIGTASPSAKLNVVTSGGNSRISIGDTAVATYSTVLMYGGNGKYNWQLGAQANINNGFEITPSTAAGGTTFSTPAFIVDSTGASTFTGTGKFATTIGVGNATPAASGSGITFPATQSASSDANTLDDYEEGDWTPVLLFGGAAGVTAYSAQNGTYTKVGNTVTVRCYIYITTKSAATGVASLTGLPFNTKGGATAYHTAYIYFSSGAITGAPMCYIGPNNNSVNLGQTNGSTGFFNMNQSNFADGTDFIFQATYLTA